MILLHRYAEKVAPVRRGHSGTQTATRTRAEAADSDQPAILGTRTFTKVNAEATDPDDHARAAIIPRIG